MNLINTLRMYAEDIHSATGYNERSSAMSKAADMIEKFENMSACEACATIPSVMEYVQQLEQERDELKEKVARLSALLEAEPFRNERIEQLEQERDTLILAVADHVTARSDQAAALKLARIALSGWIGSPNTEQYAALAAIDALKI